MTSWPRAETSSRYQRTVERCAPLFLIPIIVLGFLAPIVGIFQLAAINQGLEYFGLPWWAAMLLAPPVAFIPLIGPAIGSVGGIFEWHLYRVPTIAFMFLPGRRQFILWVLSRATRR